MTVQAKVTQYCYKVIDTDAIDLHELLPLIQREAKNEWEFVTCETFGEHPTAKGVRAVLFRKMRAK